MVMPSLPSNDGGGRTIAIVTAGLGRGRKGRVGQARKEDRGEESDW